MNDFKGTNPWKYIESQDFQKAVDIYSELFRKEGYANHLRNKAIALMNLGQFRLAIEALKNAISITGKKNQNSGDFTKIGVCNWCENMYGEALSFWKDAENAPYTKYGSLIPLSLQLYWAIRLEKPDYVINTQKKLKGEMYETVSWPGMIVSMLTNDDRREDMEKFVTKNEIEPFQQRLLCNVNFYTSIYHYMNGNKEGFKSEMQKAAENPNGYLEDVYYVAIWEVKNNFPNLNFSKAVKL